ncbi:hypothetical protein [Acinetobacter gerneri]|uniref:hypothetical protein n=1 Tax=Acinetobacter gerneri TaxID=202952 RepID=UPI003A88D4AA
MSLQDNIDVTILNFLNQKTFLAVPVNPNKINFDILKITDPSYADDIFSQTLDADIQNQFDDWETIIANEIISIKEIYRKNNSDITGLYIKISNFVEKKVEEKIIKNINLNEKIPYLLDSIYSDFTKIVFNDYTKLNNQFFNNLLQVYLAGGWPCGWEGQYPKGKLVIFSNE